MDIVLDKETLLNEEYCILYDANELSENLIYYCGKGQRRPCLEVVTKEIKFAAAELHHFETWDPGFNLWQSYASAVCLTGF